LRSKRDYLMCSVAGFWFNWFHTCQKTPNDLRSKSDFIWCVQSLRL
jgi:hypothetical protein